jgi:acyl-CoA synthetase (AMP-forming)/AMP-acid ligase II
MAGLISLVRAAEASYPTRVAARNGTASDGPASLTFGEVGDRSDRLASVTRTLHGPGDGVVASLLGNRIEAIELDIALVKAGLGRVSLNPRLVYDEVRYIVQNSQARVLIYDTVYADVVEQLVGEVDGLTCLHVGVEPGPGRSYNDTLAEALPTTETPIVSADAPSLLMYTSGTTGRPKGANWTFGTRFAAVHNMLINELDSAAARAMLHVGSLSHGSGSKIVPVYVRGGCNIVMNRFDPGEFFRVARETSATATFVVPTMVQMLIDAATDEPHEPFPTMCHVAYGGAKMPLPTIHAALERFGNVFFQVYGSCETPHPVLKLDRLDHATRDPRILSSAGHPSIGVDIRVGAHDASSAGAQGELLVRGEHVMCGYWSDPEATEAAFTDGYYRTGDVVRVHDDGVIEIVDRVKNMIISGGFNVYPAEVERVLQSHPAIAQASVYGLPDAKWGEVVGAAVVSSGHPLLTVEELDAYCAERMAGYKKPRSFRFVDRLPLGPTGKVLTAELQRTHEKEAVSGA